MPGNQSEEGGTPARLITHITRHFLPASSLSTFHFPLASPQASARLVTRHFLPASSLVLRHPIYASLVISYSVVALRSYSPRNALLIGLGIFWFWLKCLVEERFLRTADPAYAVYMQEVRYRWIPGLF